MRKFIIECTKPVRFWIFVSAFGNTFWAINRWLYPFLLKQLINITSTLPHQNAFDALTIPGLLLLTSQFSNIVLMRLHQFAWAYLNPPMKRFIGLKMMERMMLHSYSFFQNQFAGNLSSRVKDVMSSTPDFVRLVIDNVFGNIFLVFVAIFAFSAVSKQFVMMLIPWFTITLIGTFFISKKLYTLSIGSAEARSRAVGTIADIFSNIINIRLFSRYKAEKDHLTTYLNKYVEADQKRDYKFIQLSAFHGVTFFSYQVVVLYFLVDGFKNSTVTPGDFALILMLNISIQEALREIAKDMGRFADLLGSIKQGISLIVAPIEIEDAPNAKELVVTKGEIRFENVNFRYKAQKLIFADKNIVIKPYQKIGLVGFSGAGKSTFVNLILRLFDCESGKILIDGQNIKEVTHDSLMAHIAMIPQDPILFHRTLMENIRYGRVNATDEEVFEAAKKAFAYDFIKKIPEGFNALVGERGVKLSGGQRQRIAIARAFLKNAPILILDEATSQLDSVSEQKIQASLSHLMVNKTTIVIAHRLSTLLHMDRILVFDAGKIIEEGTHQELLAKAGTYNKMWNAQIGGFLPEML